MRLLIGILSCLVLLAGLGSPSAWSQTTPADDRRSSLQLQFNQVEVATVAQRLAWLTEAQVTLDPGVSGPISLQTQQPVSPNEAWDLFAQALSAKGWRLSQVSPGVYGVSGVSGPKPPAPAMATDKIADKPAEIAATAPAPANASSVAASSSAAPKAKAAAAAKQMEIFVELAPLNRPPIQNSTPNQADMPAPLDPTRSTWSILSQDKSLYHVISRWAQTANWQLMWEADRDFPIQAQISIDGTFTSAIQMVMDSLSNTDYPLQAVMNPNTRVLSVVRHLDASNR